MAVTSYVDSALPPALGCPWRAEQHLPLNKAATVSLGGEGSTPLAALDQLWPRGAMTPEVWDMAWGSFGWGCPTLSSEAIYGKFPRRSLESPDQVCRAWDYQLSHPWGTK